MKIYKINNFLNKKLLLQELKVTNPGIDIILNKMELLFFKIINLKTPALHILKQDALSIGAELAVPSGAILFKKDYYDCILIGTRKHIKILSKKELSQPFGLKSIAKELKNILEEKEYIEKKIMGIMNINNDSFYSKSRFSQINFLENFNKIVSDGAVIIDIGAVSSRPNSIPISEKEELNKLSRIFEIIQNEKLYKKVICSIDSYNPLVVEKALNSGFSIINDITGAKNIDIIKLAMKYNAKLIIMHMNGNPQNMQNNPSYNNLIEDISIFFEEQINKCLKLGLLKKNIILDFGIGFGKTTEHNIELIKNIPYFKKFNCEILIGASRKSIIDSISSSSIDKRLGGTLAIHLKSIEYGASIIRCHDVYEHNQAISLWRSI